MTEERNQLRRRGLQSALVAILFLSPPYALVSVAKPPRDLPPDVIILASKQRPEAGSSLDVFMQVKNLSDHDIYIQMSDSTLIFPPQLSAAEGAIGRPFTYFSSGPIEWYRLKPNDETLFYASTVNYPTNGQNPQDPTKQQGAWQSIGNDLKDFWSFSPGAFKLAAVVYYASTPDKANIHVLTKTVDLSFAAPQTIILLGAGLGGLFAWILFLRTEQAPANQKALYLRVIKTFGDALSAILLAVVVTILVSRVANTQFFIKVNIEDIWGAIATGFAAAVAGKRFLRGLVGNQNDSVSPKTPQEEPKAQIHVTG